jgi:uncharacterized protein with HEPN domain
MRSIKNRLLDIIEAIQKISERVGDEDQFRMDELRQVWVIHHLQIIGEAASGLPDEFQDAYPQIPWKKLIGMRNVLVHGYFHIDLEIVWTTVVQDLPILLESASKILVEIDNV